MHEKFSGAHHNKGNTFIQLQNLNEKKLNRRHGTKVVLTAVTSAPINVVIVGYRKRIMTLNEIPHQPDSFLRVCWSEEPRVHDSRTRRSPSWHSPPSLGLAGVARAAIRQKFSERTPSVSGRWRKGENFVAMRSELGASDVPHDRDQDLFL